MADRTIEASEFAARSVALLHEVEVTRDSLVVTERGRSIAKVVPLDAPASTSGSVTLLAADDGSYFSVGEEEPDVADTSPRRLGGWGVVVIADDFDE